MVKIDFVRSLSHYEDYSNAKVYQYDDGLQKKFFDVDYINGKPGVLENGNLVSPSTYDAIVSLIGKTHLKSLLTEPVKGTDEIKRNIKEFFMTHSVGFVKTPPCNIFFE